MSLSVLVWNLWSLAKLLLQFKFELKVVFPTFCELVAAILLAIEVAIEAVINAEIVVHTTWLAHDALFIVAQKVATYIALLFAFDSLSIAEVPVDVATLAEVALVQDTFTDGALTDAFKFQVALFAYLGGLSSAEYKDLILTFTFFIEEANA